MSILQTQLSVRIREAERMHEERAKSKKQIHELQEEIKSLKGTGVGSPLARAVEEVMAQEPDPLARQIFFKIVQNGEVIDMPSHDPRPLGPFELKRIVEKYVKKVLELQLHGPNKGLTAENYVCYGRPELSFQL
jgi:uncharacterized protein (UPF0335 family)